MSSRQEILMLPIGSVKPDPNQPRTEWDKHEEHVEELAASYSKHGIIQPLEVDEKNVIILGECRWRAAKKAGLKEVPVRRVKTPTPADRLERQLIDDVQRKELNEEERRWAYATAVANINDPLLAKQENREPRIYTVHQIREICSKDRLTVLNLLQSGSNKKGYGMESLTVHLGVDINYIDSALSYFVDEIPNVAREAADEGLMRSYELKDIRTIETPRVREVLATSIAKERREIRSRPRPKKTKERVRSIRELERAGASEDILTSVAREEIQPETAKEILRVPAKMQSKAIEIAQEEHARNLAESEADTAKKLIDMMPRPDIMEMPPEQIAEIQERVKEQEKILAEKRADPKVQRKARLFQSWLSLGTILGILDSTVCPICEKTAKDNLAFKCHPDMTIEKARVRTAKERGIVPAKDD